jgi:hypothetical protein
VARVAPPVAPSAAATAMGCTFAGASVAGLAAALDALEVVLGRGAHVRLGRSPRTSSSPPRWRSPDEPGRR